MLFFHCAVKPVFNLLTPETAFSAFSFSASVDRMGEIQPISKGFLILRNKVIDYKMYCLTKTT